MFATLAPLHDLIDKVDLLEHFDVKSEANFSRVRKRFGRFRLTRHSGEICTRLDSGATHTATLTMLRTSTKRGIYIIRSFGESRVTCPIS